MKKIIYIILAISLIACIAGCGKKNENNEKTKIPEKKVGYLSVNGMSEEKFKDKLLQTGEFQEEENPSSIVPVLYDDLTSLLLALDRKDIESASLYNCVTEYIMKKNPDKYAKGDYVNHSVFSMAVKDGNDELLSKLNLAIDTLKYDGTFEKLKNDYINNFDANNMPVPSEIEKIEGAETIKVVVTGDLPPLDYMTAEGIPAGYNVALMAALSKELGMNIELISANAASRSAMVATGKADVIFWTRGVVLEGRNDPDFSMDLPEGLVATNPYFATNVSMLYTK